MRNHRIVAAVFVAALLAVPAVSATWYGAGTYEPDTLLDAEGPYMWADPDTDPNDATRKVYFNAFSTYVYTGVNANVGTLGTKYRPAPLMYFEALLGVWKDCNDDGYIGVAESATYVYPSAALDNTDICPPTPTDDAHAAIHNDGEWVYEFLWIGPLAPTSTTTASYAPGVLNATDEDGNDLAFVWGDSGVPGGVPGTSCPLAPPPHGTTSSTGRVIRWADCLQAGRITSTVNSLDPDGSLGLRFQCDNLDDEECKKNPQESNSLLNQDLPESLFGNPGHKDGTGKETGTLQKDPENDGEYVATVWDCDGDEKGTADIRDPSAPEGERGQLSQFSTQDPRNASNTIWVNWTDEEGSIAWLGAIDPQVGSPTWSAAGSVNHTFAGLQGCDDGNTYNGAHATAFFYADGDHEGTAQAPGKDQASLEMTFFDGSTASSAARAGVCSPESVEVNETTYELPHECTPGLGERTHPYAGVRAGTWLFLEGWSAGVIYVTYIPQSVSTSTGEPLPANYWTFYARIDPETISRYSLDLAFTGYSTYGSENCVDGIGPGAEKQNGWVCDPDLWYLDPQGKDISEEHEQRVGAPYNLRDVDCFDGTIARGAPVRASLVDLAANPGPCADAPQ